MKNIYKIIGGFILIFCYFLRLDISFTNGKIYMKAIESKYIAEFCQLTGCNMYLYKGNTSSFLGQKITDKEISRIVGVMRYGTIDPEIQYNIEGFYLVDRVVPRLGWNTYDICLKGNTSLQERKNIDNIENFSVDFCYPIIRKAGTIVSDEKALENRSKEIIIGTEPQMEGLKIVSIDF